MNEGGEGPDGLRSSVDRGVQVMATLEAVAVRHSRLIVFQNVIMLVLLLALVVLTSTLAIYTRALFGCY